MTTADAYEQIKQARRSVSALQHSARTMTIMGLLDEARQQLEYLDPTVLTPACPLCDGSRVVVETEPVGDGTVSHTIPCPRCTH